MSKSAQRENLLILTTPGPCGKTPAQRFWSKVIVAKPDDCWLWTGPTIRPNGYGVLNVDHCNIYAHRIAYILACGPIPESKIVCHKCDIPACCNPNHLFMGTHYDNVHDKLAKGRYHWTDRRGEKSPFHKLTNQQVLQIRSLYVPRCISLRKLAKMFGVSKPTIKAIVAHQTWRNLD